MVIHACASSRNIFYPSLYFCLDIWCATLSINWFLKDDVFCSIKSGIKLVDNFISSKMEAFRK
jgi:hypothetical protein